MNQNVHTLADRNQWNGKRFVYVLIATYVGRTSNLDERLGWHNAGPCYVNAAKKRGATKEEISEALGVATALNAGAALVFSARLMEALTDRPTG